MKNTMTRFKQHSARSLILMVMVAQAFATLAAAIAADRSDTTPGSAAIHLVVLVCDTGGTWAGGSHGK